MRNPTFSDDDDFETPIPKTKSKPYTTNLRTEDGVRKEIRLKFAADNSKLTPKALSLRNEKGNRLKKRATKLKRTIIDKHGVQASDVEEERGQLPKHAEQKKQLKKRNAINKLVSNVSIKRAQLKRGRQSTQENQRKGTPTRKGWTRQALKQRQAAELKAKVFGRGDIIKPRWQEQGKNVESTAEKEATVSSPTTREQEQ
ncbi:hypothetical protein DCAR_0205796 [Daucus carota subsp. sativus]|uniref:Uncharacterized protein n=1 Tax=Daucus carota subsp. sativus TaxID=79200 RepID=A0A166CTJ8_DAUCS|nr:hypothetical protein DCAR_0205796 [Daucus carota subsp. sativus]